jgi:hypothetical protein
MINHQQKNSILILKLEKMKKNLSRIMLLLISSILLVNSSFAQTTGTLEMTFTGNEDGLVGANTTPVTVTFLKDLFNPVINAGVPTFASSSPTLTATYSYRAQTKSTTLTNTTTLVPGMTFGGISAPSFGAGISNTPTTPQIIGSVPVYEVFGGQIAQYGKLKNTMFATSPTSTPFSATTPFGDAVGAPAVGKNIQAGMALPTGPNGADINMGVSLYNSVEPLFDANELKNGRFLYGQLVITFNRPVKNPVVHIGGMGGSYTYLPKPSVANPNPTYQISYFTTELELQNGGVTSTFMAGNANISLVGNNILNSSATPNGGSSDDGSAVNGFANYGAASGSIRVNGVVSELVYNVYVRGSSNSDFNFSKTKADISGAFRDPHNGDLYYVGISLDKPTQQISGNIFIDRDGLTNNNINTSVGVDNPKTNLGGSLFANLLNTTGQVVASIPVSNDGIFLFDNVPVGIYSVQLTTNASSGTYASPAAAPATVLPAGWANTGEFVGNTVGSDGTVNGASSSVVVGSEDIKVEVNFGIERLPESNSYVNFINKPGLNDVLTLNGGIFNMPVLSGSDPEDQPAPGSLATKSLRIDTLPNNAILLYNGVQVFAGQVIPSYDPTRLQVKFTIPGAGISGIVKFNYSYIDAAGLADPTPAFYTIQWPAGGPLPIILSFIGATKDNCNASINWKTSSELDSEKFEVEFSTATNTSFESVGTIGASGNSTTTKSYQFNYGMESGVSYYFRLKMYKKDGTFTYSQILPLSCIDTKASITIVPNPTNTGAFQIRNMAKGKNTVSIYSNDGKLIRTENVINNKDVNISNLAAGTYVIRILNENGTASVERLVKY